MPIGPSKKGESSNSTTRRKALEIRVCFDANAIHNDSALHLLAVGVKDLIGRHSSHSDVSLSWYIPKMVRGEREFRMQRAAEQLLPKVQDVETLLGVNLNITKANVREQVTRRIDREIAEVGLRVLECDSGRVAWERVFTDAASRRPPFEGATQEKEKGFRDLVIGEAFLQLVEDSPASKKTCQAVLVTNDALLTQMIQARAIERENVRVLADLAAVDEYINTLASEATEEYVASIRNIAARLFFVDAGTKSAFYYTSVDERVAKILANLQRDVPKDAEKVTIEELQVLPPTFADKSKQRVTWLSRILVSLRATREESYLDLPTGVAFGSAQYTPPPSIAKVAAIANLGFGPLGAPMSSGITISPSSSYTGLFDRPETPQVTTLLTGSSVPAPLWKRRDATVFKGLAEIEIRWTVTVTTAKKLKKPAIVDCNLTKTTWGKED
jgi:hypothetical protein